VGQAGALAGGTWNTTGTRQWIQLWIGGPACTDEVMMRCAAVCATSAPTRNQSGELSRMHVT
jgi:hypothetical protein